MTTNGTNTTEDTEMGEYDGDKVVTMLDVLQEEQDFEEDANAVLGASDDKNCSYNKGYIKRQAIYACMTCCSDAKINPLKRAGVCLACSLTCHENHELVELYTKRNFRCDCGNAKFNSHPCKFNPNKTDLNEENQYNQNYSGLYCTCHRPYPDPESTTEDEMIQCIICEDWLHASHLDAVVPDEPYSEMICKDCMEKNIFLHDYSSLVITTESVDVDNVSSSDAITMVNGIPESEGTSENTKVQDVEMKNEADLNVSDKTNTENALQTENKNESVNSESDAMKDSTNELEKVESEDVSNETNSKTTPEIEEKENSCIESVEAKTEKDQLTEDKVTNVISEKTTLSPDQNKVAAESNLLDNKDLSVDEETIDNSTKDVNKEESKEPIPQDTDVTTTNKADSAKDEPITHDNESKDITDNDLKMEEELLKDPTDTEAPSNQKPEEIDTEITKSNIESDKEPVTDTTNETAKDAVNEPAIDTTNEAVVNKTSEVVMDTTIESAKEMTNEPAMEMTKEPALDTTIELPIDTITEPVAVTENIPVNETLMDAKDGTEKDFEKKKESDSSNLEIQPTVSENPETSSTQTSNLESLNTLETDTQQARITDDDSTKIEKDSTKTEESNSVNQSNEESNVGDVDETVASSNENKRKLTEEEGKDDGAKRIKPNESKSCIRPKGIKRYLKGATFWPSNFRQKLCTCNECLSMYKDLAVLFLIDSEDTVAAYEMLGKERSNGNSQYEKGLQALSSLDRIQQINAVTEYNKLREKLSDFLKTFMLKKEIVKEEDIKAFFAGMKPKREPDGVYFCR
ncbi:Putative E3 ubiquitin-protein ligase UBR7 [Papilio machaon]|uniref:Putative E3 ubiquitin-protein ligase UBR7 n=1 Tax=Papilio machaon TaxID=76193 RepID=A0A194QN96_PAPMA|nr:Putative E3 ubiquitin-protein ligase UBR7 [Papilio machaon]